MEYAQLGRAVLVRAFRDSSLQNPFGDDARSFLTQTDEEGDLAFWCKVAQVPFESVTTAARRLSAEGWRK